MTMMAIMAGCKFEFEFCTQFSSELRANYFAFIIPAGNFNSAVYDIYYIFLRFILPGMIFTIKKHIDNFHNITVGIPFGIPTAFVALLLPQFTGCQTGYTAKFILGQFWSFFAKIGWFLKVVLFF